MLSWHVGCTGRTPVLTKRRMKNERRGREVAAFAALSAIAAQRRQAFSVPCQPMHTRPFSSSCRPCKDRLEADSERAILHSGHFPTMGATLLCEASWTPLQTASRAGATGSPWSLAPWPGRRATSPTKAAGRSPSPIVLRAELWLPARWPLPRPPAFYFRECTLSVGPLRCPFARVDDPTAPALQATAPHPPYHRPD